MESTITDNVPAGNTFGFAVLPVEIIHQILLQISPQELVLLQRVSKQFHAVINNRTFWKTVYANAHLSRPPGPLDWQSTNVLQRTLVRSARLERSWTSQPVNVVSRSELTLEPYNRYSNSQVVCGRWLIFLRGDRLLARDIDTGSEWILDRWNYKYTEWLATYRTSTRGHIVYVLLVWRNNDTDRAPRLLEFQADDHSGRLSGPVTYQVPMTCKTGGVLKVEGGDTPFVFIRIDMLQALARSLVFDTRSHIFYRFPPETDEKSPFYQSMSYCDELILTTTHIIVSLDVSLKPVRFCIRAYMVPDDSQTLMLRLSHKTIIDNQFWSWSLLQNSSIDPICGSTFMRLLDTASLPPNDLQLRCLDITLAAPVSDHVLPISIEVHPVFVISSVGYDAWTHVVEPSAYGLARGLAVSDRGPNLVYKFSIDATGEQCVGTTSGPFPLRLGLDHRSWRISSFDGSRGRLYYARRSQGSGDLVTATILDLK